MNRQNTKNSNKTIKILLLAVIFLGGLYLVMLMTDKKEKIDGKVEEISDSNFKDKINDGVVFVDFYATWCAPCRRMSPIIENLADGMKDDVKFYKIDVDLNPATSIEYGIESLPTFVVYVNGIETNRVIGMQSKAGLASILTVARSNSN